MKVKTFSLVFLAWLSFAGFCLLTILSSSSGVSAQSLESENAILNYNPPIELQKQLPYFLSGLDKEGSPVWVLEFGAWDLRGLSAKGPEYPDLIEKYTDQMLQRIHDSPKSFGEDEYILLVDLAGYDLGQFRSYSSLQIIFHMCRQFVRLHRGGQRAKQIIVVNSNYLADTVYRLVKPILGDVTSFVDFYGSNPSKWTPVILRHIQKDQIPSWLGGSPSHVPLKIYG